jgi:hypothetical protein
MKKILFIIILMSGFLLKAQDSIQLSTTTIKNTTLTTSYFPYFEFAADTLMYRITGEYLMPWIYNGSSTIYPRTTSYNLSLGYAAGITGYKLVVYGKGYFQNDLYLGSGKYLRLDGLSGTSCYLRYTGGNMVLYDPVAGSKTLTELAAYDSSEVRTEELSFIPKATPTAALGKAFFKSTDSTFNISLDGTTWTEVGSGAGTIDSAGGQGAYDLAFWTNSTHIDGSATYQIISDVFTITNSGASDGLVVKDGATTVFHIDDEGNIFHDLYDDTDTGIVYITPAGKFIYDSISVAPSWQYKSTPLFWKYFLKRINGETNWPRQNGDSYYLRANTMTQLQAGIERAYIWIARRDAVIVVLVLLIILLAVNQYKIKKELKRCVKR